MAFTETSRTGLHDQRGFTPLEALIAASAFLFILFAVYLVHEGGRNTFARGETKTDIQQNARMALSTMERELRMAGTGVPAPCCAGTTCRIVEARPRKISLRGDLRNVLSNLTAQANAGTSSLTVNTTSGIVAGANPDVIYITDGTMCDIRTVSTVGATTLTLTSNLTNSYVIGSQVFRPKDVNFTIGGGQLTRDEGNPNVVFPVSPRVLAQKVQNQDTLSYYDLNNAVITANNPVANPDNNIRRIRIALLTSGTPPGLALQSYTLTSDVRPRNL